MNGNRTSSRLRHAIILALGLGIGNFAFALRLGPINVKSYLGQPINATIRVDGLSAAAASNTKVSLASPAAYRSHGIEMLPIHSQMRFSLTPSGKSYIIHVSSTSGVKEPFVNFLVTVSGNGSTVTREYAAFFNPNPANSSAGKSNNPTVVVEKERKSKVLAERANPPKTRSHAANTSGWGGKPAKKTPPKKAEPVRPVAASTPAAAVASGSPNTPSSIPVNSHYGPIKPGETLYSIAKAARPSESIRIPDMMRLIYKANRRAFARNNMGNLMAGATLYIPDPGQRKSAASKPAPEPKAVKPTPKPEPKAKPTPPKSEPKTVKPPTSAPKTTPVETVKPENMPTSPNAQLAFGVDNGKKVEEKKTEIPTPPVVAEKEEPQPQGLKVKVDPPESIETQPKVEVPPPVIELPKPEPVELPPEELQPEPQPQPAPLPPPRPAPVVRKPAPAPIPAPPPEDDSFFGLGKYIPDFGIPLPLLGGAFAGLLALLGGLFWFLKKRKKSNDDDHVEEFTEEQIQRMVAEMEEEHGDLDFDQITSSQISDDSNHEPPMITKLDPISEPYADDSSGSIEEISDDFFKDLEVNVEEGADTGFLADETITDNSEISDNFFDDLEFDNDADTKKAPATNKENVADDFDDFLAGSNFSNDDFLDDLDNDDGFAEFDQGLTLDKKEAVSTEPATDDFDNLFSTSNNAAEDDFFADPEKDNFTELSASSSESSNHDLDFLDGLDITETPTEAEKPQLELTKDDDSTLDFFTDIEQPKESKKEKTVDFSTVNDDNTLDFFTTADEKKSDKFAAENDFFADEVTSVDLKKEEEKTTADTLDFFTDPISEAIAPESVSTKPATPKTAKPTATKLPPITPPTVDEDAMEINLDMAKSFISMGKSEKARSWLEEVLELGTEAQKAQANKMLAKIEKG